MDLTHSNRHFQNITLTFLVKPTKVAADQDGQTSDLTQLKSVQQRSSKFWLPTCIPTDILSNSSSQRDAKEKRDIQMSDDLKENRSTHSDRRIIRQIGLLMVCVASALFLTNCGAVALIVMPPAAENSYTTRLTQYRRTLQFNKEIFTEDSTTSATAGNEEPVHTRSPWNTTWGVLSTAGYTVTVPADITKATISIPCYAFDMVIEDSKTNSATAILTEYRRIFLPKKSEYTETTCTFQGTVIIASQEYLRYHTNDFANWDKTSEGITYFLPKQGNSPVLVSRTNSPTTNKPDVPAGIVFDLEGKSSQADLEAQQDKKIKFYLEKLKTGYKLSTYKPDSIVYVCATRSGKGSRIALFTRKKAEWDLSGSYVIEEPIYENPWGINTLRNAALCAGYAVTVPTDAVLATVRTTSIVFLFFVPGPIV
jgi:hypothetical protein